MALTPSLHLCVPCPTSQHGNIFDPLLGVSWWFHDAGLAHSVNGPSLWPARRFVTLYQTAWEIRILAGAASSDVCWRRIYLHCTEASSILEMFQDDTLYEVTYLLTYSSPGCYLLLRRRNVGRWHRNTSTKCQCTSTQLPTTACWNCQLLRFVVLYHHHCRRPVFVSHAVFNSQKIVNSGNRIVSLLHLYLNILSKGKVSSDFPWTHSFVDLCYILKYGLWSYRLLPCSL